MIYEFRYLAPKTASELVAILDGNKADGKILAGGTDLIPNIRNGLQKPRLVIDIKKYAGADKLAFGSDGLTMGPAVTINDILRSRDARERFPVLCECAHELASHQIRNRATVAGNVVNASPCSDMAPALLCLGASAVLRSASGERVVPFAKFFAGVKKTVLSPGEFLERIIVPASAAGATGRYLKLKRIAGHDLGIVGVLMTRAGGALRFAVSSAAPTPVLVESVTLKDSPDEAASKVLAAVSPISDVRGTKEYREHMIGVYVRRLLAEVK
jgi:carbon-monoxide dehydrogenase medium subunit